MECKKYDHSIQGSRKIRYNNRTPKQEKLVLVKKLFAIIVLDLLDC